MMNVSSILVIRYSGLGDIVMLLQTLEKLKMKYNNPTITLLTDHSNMSILENTCGIIDEIIPINRKIFKGKKILAIFNELQKLFYNLRKKRYNLLIDFQNFGETATISYLAKADLKIGAPKKKKYNYGYTKIVKIDLSGHRSQYFSRIAGVSDKLDFSKLCLEDNGKKYKEVLATKVDKNKKTVGFNIGSTQESRRWSEKNFYYLAKDLEKEYNILIFIGPSEIKFESLFKSLHVIKNTSLTELCGAISMCDFFVSNDTGPVHIAAALNVSTLTLFSTGTDDNVGSLISKKDSIHNKNINNILVEDVKGKLIKLIN